MTFWATVKLGELAGFRNGLNFTAADRGKGLAIVGVSDFQNRSFVEFENLEELVPSALNSPESLIQRDDILFVRSNGNRELIGRSLFVAEAPPMPTSFSGFCIRLRFQDERADPKFYSYLLRSGLIRRKLSSQGGGTNINNLNQGILTSLEVPLPPVETQRRIASILGAYDDLIEVNRRRIKLLEEMARGLFEEWFVRFRFPGHETLALRDTPNGPLPEGWQWGELGHFVALRRDKASPGAHLADRKYVPIECIGRRDLALLESEPWENAQSSLQLFEVGDILFGAMRAYFHKVVPAPFAGVTRSTCFVLRPCSPELFSFATLLLFRDETVAFAAAQSKGSTIPYVQWLGVLEKMSVPHPPMKTLKGFEECTRPIINLILGLAQTNVRLAASRDLLLPRLISGQLSVEAGAELLAAE